MSSHNVSFSSNPERNDGTHESIDKYNFETKEIDFGHLSGEGKFVTPNDEMLFSENLGEEGKEQDSAKDKTEHLDDDKEIIAGVKR